MRQCVQVAVLMLAALMQLAAVHADSNIRSDPVRVEFYMEALCPYCANFTLTSLKPLFKNKLINFVELDVIPWGNAHVDVESGNVACQHGERECQLNKLLSCAIAQHPIQDDWFPFLTCIEELALGDRSKIVVEEAAHKCAVHAGMASAKLLACYNGLLGTALQRLAAERTNSLQPPHQYVPWVVVNGIPLLDDFDTIMKFICVAYTGRDRPAACLDVPKETPDAQLVLKKEKQRKQQDKPQPKTAMPCKRGMHIVVKPQVQ